MKLTFNTKNVNIQVALKALNHYRKEEFLEASEALIEILDMEPQNWDARLMLGACYYRTDHFFSAERCFRIICEQAHDSSIRARAREGLISTSARLGKRVSTPPEFGSCAVREDFVASWLS